MSPTTISPVNTTGGVTINNGEQVFTGRLEINQEWIDITSAIATKPDPAWEFIDAAGHFHAYDADGELPTLVTRTRHVECDHDHYDDFLDDDTCEGYDVVEQFCRICDQQIEPNRLPDPGPKSMPGRKDWTITVVGDGPITGLVSVRFAINGKIYFGVAHAEYGPNGPRMTHRLHGAGPLGVRTAPWSARMSA